MTLSNAIKYVTVAASDADWDAVYAEQLPRVYNFFRYRVGPGPLAEDLTAATFEKAWSERVRYRRDLAAFSTWLFTIARNVAVDHLRQLKQERSLDDVLLVADDTLEAVVQRRSDHERLAVLLAALPARERELIALKYGADLTNRAIAELTGLSESNVGTILQRTVRRLGAQWKVKMDKQYDEPIHDEFLHAMRAEPRPEFAEELYTRIVYQRRWRMLPRRKLFAPQRMVWATTALCFVLGTLIWTSPIVRAEVIKMLNTVGGITFNELEQYPQHPAESVIVPQETISVAQARMRLPFAFGLPTWMPDGFMLIDEARVVFFDGQPHNAQFTWRKDEPQEPEIWTTIMLSVEPRKPGEGSYQIARGSVEEVQIKGQPAALVRGAWNADTQQWETNDDINPQTGLPGVGNVTSLHWVANDVGYHLTGFKQNVSEEDLIKIAESIQ